MTVEEIIRGSTLPRLEAELLTSAAMGKARTWVLAHGEAPVPERETERIREYFRRRQEGEPVAYITGTKEFYGRPFHVTPAVLIPRPSTESLVDLALRFIAHHRNESSEVDTNISVVARALRSFPAPRVVVDCGTGSGCIAVTLALVLPACRIIATDVSEAALLVARGNALAHGVENRITFLRGAEMHPVQDLKEPFVVVSNPPYIPAGKDVPRDVGGFEPHEALFAGDQGTAVLKEIVCQAARHPFCSGIVLECQTDQRESLQLP